MGKIETTLNYAFIFCKQRENITYWVVHNHEIYKVYTVLYTSNIADIHEKIIELYQQFLSIPLCFSYMVDKNLQ